MRRGVVGVAWLVLAACGEPQPSGGVAGVPSGLSSGVSSGVSAQGSVGSAGSAGACAPGEKQACYPGEASTRGVGACRAGERSCEGGVLGPCVGAVTPKAAPCGDPHDVDCDGAPKACTGRERASRRLAGPDEQGVGALAARPEGGVWLAGYTLGPLELAPGQRVEVPPGGGRWFLAALDDASMPRGALTRLTPLDDTFVGALASHGRGLALSGTYDREVRIGAQRPITTRLDTTEGAFVASLDHELQVRWAKAYTRTCHLSAVAASGELGVWIACGGSRFGSALYAERLDDGGRSVWTWQPDVVGGAGGQALAVAADASGAAYVGGHTNGPLALAGAEPLPGRGGFVVKLGPDGKPLWAKRLARNVGQLAVGPGGTLFVSGALGEGGSFREAARQGRADLGGGELEGLAFVAAFSPDGQHRWSRAVSHATDPRPFRGGRGELSDPVAPLLAPTPSGTLHVAATFKGFFVLGDRRLESPKLARDVALAHLDQRGELVWARAVGGVGQLARGLAADERGAWLGGAFVDTADGWLSRIEP
jgi:hypothetical protein